ncbi:bifunctional DNA-formamidopyrimidine glycosylase/DNA-(apurinic or apyrimidinic site) lyase [Patescibacteria group bacterium]|nr:bifunctional DNA-formamidopyrimidine glycosylase/DNA-(apurinic or apyrimidinic site) lyase [Patescibacteria group bacterium]MDE1946613.1 bifunctional DNA-formamidopyrimidine glycosylase/DNA-(apurinic or apyrimidinic site) lyase [Patescibacteria group bacterium]MDE2010567.1 bifunctional DNA-formamidopyrimidine glycosylase/DNA-(apurinic or apyrimidinic site) lyase [Patescibacteria group bacterium]MDE2233155.1 bifunctional DNA-formamidopyrimidine glycosylase/DNA-(apurinic or apyrimidinic site) l
MPELPEVQTTVNGLNRAIVGLRITDAWSDYNSIHHKGSDNIKDPRYFAQFRRTIIGSKIVSAERRAKNVLINLNHSKTILIHMKMTGHLLYGEYTGPTCGTGRTCVWQPIAPEPLKDPFNRHIHLVITFTNSKRLVLSDARKFAKVTLLPTKGAGQSDHLNHIGPEPLDKTFTPEIFAARLHSRPNGKIKQVLMDQKVVAGIGNIYSDEALWRAGIHPLEIVRNIPDDKMRAIFKAVKETLSKGIDLGGDSMSDYRNIGGEPGKFQLHHRAYRKTGTRCTKKDCGGTIRRIVVGARSAHFCDKHQKLRG